MSVSSEDRSTGSAETIEQLAGLSQSGDAFAGEER